MASKPSGVFWQKLRRVAFSPSVFWLSTMGGLGLVATRGSGVFGIVAGFVFVVGVGQGIYNWIMRDDEFRIAALNDLRKRARREHFAYLNKLRRKLRQDRDPRTNQLAKQLQQLYDRSSRSDPDFDAHREDVPTAVVELFDQSTQLYQSCLDLLERSFQLWMTAKEMATDEGRTRTLDTREKLIGEVETSVHRLHDTFDRIYSAQAGATEIDTAENAELRAELERGLDVARQVEARMESLEKELRFKERA